MDQDEASLKKMLDIVCCMAHAQHTDARYSDLQHVYVGMAVAGFVLEL